MFLTVLFVANSWLHPKAKLLLFATTGLCCMLLVLGLLLEFTYNEKEIIIECYTSGAS